MTNSGNVGQLMRITQLKTRLFCLCIETSNSWDKNCNIDNDNKMVEEILLWKFN